MAPSISEEARLSRKAHLFEGLRYQDMDLPRCKRLSSLSQSHFVSEDRAIAYAVGTLEQIEY